MRPRVNVSAHAALRSSSPPTCGPIAETSWIVAPGSTDFSSGSIFARMAASSVPAALPLLALAPAVTPGPAAAPGAAVAGAVLAAGVPFALTGGGLAPAAVVAAAAAALGGKRMAMSRDDP